MTESEKLLMSAGSLEHVFPIRFPNGHEVEGLLFWCLECDTPLSLANVHGQVSSLIDEVVDITAAAACPCGKISEYRIRLRDDGSFSYLDKGKWVSKTATSRTGLSFLMRRIMFFLKLRINCFRLGRALKKLQKELDRLHRIKSQSSADGRR